MARKNVQSLRDINTKTDLFDWGPFRDCNNCDGLCMVLRDRSTVEKLVRGEKIQLFRGSRDQIHDSATRGCAFAKLLDCTPSAHEKTDDAVFFLQRADQGGPTEMVLLAILTNGQTPGQGWRLAVATSPDDPASSIIPAGPVNPDPVSPRSLVVMDLWLRFCNSGRKGHEGCPKWDARVSILPTRVINVMGEVPRLYTPLANDTGPYASLSYCWGGPQPHSTTTARLAEYHNGLPMDILPATIQDAITLTRALEIPFLWIDSLCIIQDSVSDKAKEIAKMSQVYKNSWVTFSAATASSCNDGFLGVQEATRNRLSHSVTIPMACPNGLTGNVMLSQPRFLGVNMRFEDKYPIDRRAWTYQEYLLSPRVISFYHDSIEFRCLRGALTDDGLKAEEGRLNPPAFARTSTLRPIFFRPETQTSFRPFGKCLISSDERKALRGLWDDVVAEYSMGRLADPDDKLTAISAVASEFHRILGDQYLAGLWQGNLIHDLQWFRFPPYHGGSQTPRYRIPTWSWASIIDSSIYPHEAEAYKIQSTRVQVLHCSVDIVSREAPFSHVRGGQLTIRGPMKCMSLRDSWELFGCGPSVDYTKTIGEIYPDYRWNVPKDKSVRSNLGIPPDRGPLFFLGLSMRQKDSYETCGLVLLETGDNRYERVGLFKVGGVDELIPIRPIRQQIATARWGNDYEVRTISIC